MKMTFSIFIAAVLCVGSLHAEDKRLAAPFSIYKTEEAPELGPNEAEYIFEFQNLNVDDKTATITLQMDNGSNEKLKLKKGKLTYRTTSGSHRFIVYINENYFELYSHDLIIEAQTRQYYYVNVQSTKGLQIEVDKPVIYLYPERVEPFIVKVVPKGEFLFTYPEYKNEWTGTMKPDGTLTINDENYRYLFWESQQKMNAMDPEKTAGFVVKNLELSAFLEEKLNSIGFTSTERADFLTYWVPQMQRHNQVFITFHQDTDCEQFANLDITPQPDNLHRFYMSWGVYEGNENPKPQTLEPMNREGFTVLEWGGQEVPVITKTIEL